VFRNDKIDIDNIFFCPISVTSVDSTPLSKFFKKKVKEELKASSIPSITDVLSDDLRSLAIGLRTA